MAKRPDDGEQNTTVAALRPDKKNRRRHTPRNVSMIGDALRDVGAARSIVIDETGEVLAGNGVLEAAPAAGISKVRIVDVDGDTIVAVRRSGLSPDQKRKLAMYDNRAGELSEWNTEQLAEDRLAGLDLTPFWTPEEEAALKSGAAADEVERLAAADTGEERSAPATTGDFQTFSVPLTVEQERIVRAALREARRVYSVSTAGDALTFALDAWTESQKAPVA